MAKAMKGANMKKVDDEEMSDVTKSSGLDPINILHKQASKHTHHVVFVCVRVSPVRVSAPHP